MHALVDMRATDLKLTAEGVRAIAEAMQTPPVSGGSRRVAIVAGDDLGYGYGRMYELIHSSPAHVHVFRDYDEALSWVTNEANGS